jgi:hypothetical protein
LPDSAVTIWSACSVAVPSLPIHRGGQFVGLLLNPAVLQLQINGLWGLGFGNGSGSGPTTTLYFTAGYFDEAHGILGSITCCSAGPFDAQTRIIKK